MTTKTTTPKIDVALPTGTGVVSQRGAKILIRDPRVCATRAA